MTLSTPLRRLAVLCLILLLLTLTSALTAAAGALDPDFGTGGTLRMDLAVDDSARAVVQLPDGRFVVGGSGGHDISYDFILVRYFADGTPDPSFGSGGVVRTDLNFVDTLVALELLPDGRLLAAGAVSTSQINLACYLPDGSLDPSFGAGGKLTGLPGNPTSLTVQPDGKFYLTLSGGFKVQRYLPDGGLDGTYGTGGTVSVPFGTSIETFDAVLQPDGKLVVAAELNSTFALIRLQPYGGLDLTFGGNGNGIEIYWLPNGAGPATPQSVALLPDGRFIIAGGGLFNGDRHFLLMRVSSKGLFDPTFGNGYVITDFFSRNDTVYKVLAQPDGRIVAVGSCGMSPSGQQDFAVARYLPDGTLDTTFGSFGKVHTDFTGRDDWARDAFINANARLTVVGQGWGPTGQDFGLARYMLGNYWPVAQDDAVSTPEDTPVTLSGPLDPLVNDTDANGDAVQRVLVSQPAHGEVTTTGGVWRYEPDPDYTGPDSFTYRPSDGQDLGMPATVRITVTPVNDAPIAQNDAYATDEDVALNIAAPGVLSNDVDVEGGSLNAALVTPPTSGAATLSSNGALTYTPLPNFYGTDSLEYRVSDATAQGNTAVVTLTVRPRNDAPLASAQSVSVDEDSTVGITLSGIDPDGDPLTYSLASAPSHGALSGTPPNLTYWPAPGYFGTDSFTFRAADSLVQTGAATVSITVNPVNDAPTAVNDSFTGAEDQPLVVSAASGVLKNDTDPEANRLTAQPVAFPMHGLLYLGVDGSFAYLPEAGYYGLDEFTYRASDGAAVSDVATVTLVVLPMNDLPSAGDVSVSAVEDTPIVVTLAGSDPEGDPLTYAILAQPAHGTLAGTGASRLYTPQANYFGPDTLRYQVSDGFGSSGIGTVTLAITGRNDAPTVGDLSVTVAEDNVAAITLAGSDPDGDALTYPITVAPTHGMLTGSGAARTYTPQPGYSGADSFRYQASDGVATSAVATVSITVTPVNDAPDAPDFSVTTNEDTSAAVTLLGSDPEGDALQYQQLSDPAHGTLSGTAPNLTYRPAANYSGSDSFTYRVRDAAVNSRTATVTLTVRPVNDPPTAAADSFSAAEDQPLTTGAPGVLANDEDLDGDVLSAVLVTGPAHGTLALAQNGSFTYTPSGEFFGSDSFTYRVTDGTAQSGPATVSLSIAAVNDAPSAAVQSVTTAEDTARSITLAGADPDGDPLTFEVVAAPSHGTLSGTPPAVQYTPVANYSGADSFTFRTRDGVLNSTPATVSITVTPVNDAPSATAQSVTTTEDTARSLTLAGSDPEGDALTFEVVTGPAHGTLSGTLPAVQYTPAANYSGADSFTFRARDGALNSTPATVSITVTPVNDAPAATGQSVETAEDQGEAITLSGTDPDGDALTYQITAPVAHGTLTGTAPNLTYQPASNYAGPDQFRFRVSDGTAQSAEVTVEILITPVNDPPVAAGEIYTTSFSTPLHVPAPGLLANDTDPDSGALTPLLGTEPAHGTVVLGTDGSLDYTPQVGFSGTDTFTYRASDGTAQSGPVIVTLQVGSSPPAATVGSTVKGSGTIQVEGKPATFKISASVSSTGAVKGTFTFTSSTLKIKKTTFKSVRVASISGGKEALVYATVAASRTETWTLLLQLEDRGTAPGADRFALSLSTGVSTGVQPLSAGALAITGP